MMWRGAVFSSLLHGGLLIGVIGGLPILPGIFDRSAKTESTGLQVAVEVVSEAALQQMSEVAGLQNTAPDQETVAPLPRRVIGSLRPESPTQPPLPGDPPRMTDSPVSSQGTSTTARDQQRSGKPPETAQNQPSTIQASTTSVVVVVPVKSTAATPSPPQPEQSSAPNTAHTEPAPAPGSLAVAGTGTDASPAPVQEGSSTARNPSKDARDSEFVSAVSGRKRNLVVDLLEADPRLRRDVTQESQDADMPEQARSRTLARLSRSAQAGFAHAQYNLAGRYLRGEGLPTDMETAQKWLTRSAEQGYAPAQSLLALMRFTGLGAEQDQAEAAFWWLLAAEAGNPGAQLASARLRPLLKPEEHIRSQRLRTRWGSLITDLADLATGETSRREIDRALQEAAEKGDLDSVLSLLARGADADQSGDGGRNAVINAAWRGRQQIIQLLLERGVETELPDEDGRTALIWAAINGHKDVVTALVAGGANPDRRDRTGGTALIRSAWNGHTRVVAELINAGADINVRDNMGLTALAYARREQNTAIIRMLEAAGAR